MIDYFLHRASTSPANTSSAGPVMMTAYFVVAGVSRKRLTGRSKAGFCALVIPAIASAHKKTSGLAVRPFAVIAVEFFIRTDLSVVVPSSPDSTN